MILDDIRQRSQPINSNKKDKSNRGDTNSGNFRMKDNYRDPKDKPRFNERPKTTT